MEITSGAQGSNSAGVTTMAAHWAVRVSAAIALLVSCEKGDGAVETDASPCGFASACRGSNFAFCCSQEGHRINSVQLLLRGMCDIPMLFEQKGCSDTRPVRRTRSTILLQVEPMSAIEKVSVGLE